MSVRTWAWRWLSYVLISAVANAVFSRNLRDGSELLELVAFALPAILVEVALEAMAKRRRKDSEIAAMALWLGECEGPHSVTYWLCNGEPAEHETCSPPTTSLEQHLDEHAEGVLAKATELGCA